MATAPHAFEHIAIDRIEIPQQFLDVENRSRTNLFPWRGQFSPGLVEVLLSAYTSSGDVILDPFAGVGTTLVESSRKQLSCFGTEINPAAVAMAETVMFIPLRSEQRNDVLRRVRGLLDEAFESALPLFNQSAATHASCEDQLADLTKEPSLSDYERSVLTNVLIRVLASQTESDVECIHRAFLQHAEIIENLPHAVQSYAVENSDARQLLLSAGSVDLVLTSPPYINVFNYHQNNRPAMELLGWDLLHVAKSEFGANRKHRGNRFLTVIQYCLDMQESLTEIRRVIEPDGRVIFIVGRESCIRGVSFKNGLLVSGLAELCGFTLALRQERKFKNKFGTLIYEDILHLSPTQAPLKSRAVATHLAVEQLEGRLILNLKPDVEKDLRAAIGAASDVRPSPLYAFKSGRPLCMPSAAQRL